MSNSYCQLKETFKSMKVYEMGEGGDDLDFISPIPTPKISKLEYHGGYF